MEEFVCDIIKDFDEGNKNIDFVLTADEVQDFLVAFLSTGKFKPVCIDWATPEINGYDREFYFSLCRFDYSNKLFIDPVYRKEKFINIDNDSIILVSAGVKVDTYNKFVKNYNNVILFDIES